MSGWKRIFGVDQVEAVIWVVAGTLMVNLAFELTRDHVMAELTALTCLVAYAVRRHLLVRRLGDEGETSGRWRLSEVEGRLAELEALHTRVAELEERVDFNERLLAQQNDAPRLEAPKR